MRITRRVLLVFFGLFGLLAVSYRISHRAHAYAPPGGTCFITGGGELQVCHDPAAEGIFYQPGPDQVGYNTQIIDIGGGRYATVLHSEAEDTAAWVAQTGHVRAGDSIKSGIVDAAANPRAAYTAPADLDYRIWGSLTNPSSPLYYGIVPGNPAAKGLSGGGNPMVVRGRPGDPYYYVFFLGVMSDDGQGIGWRNVLLEARTADFIHFDLLQQDAAGNSVWAAFAGDNAMPAIVQDVNGNPMISNHPAVKAKPTLLRRHRGTPTAGLFGTIVYRNGMYYYFYTDEDVDDPKLNHLYVRTATDLTANRRWSAPQIVMNVPPQIMVRVAPARFMDRWAVIYMCLRSVHPFVSDLCLQYSQNMNLTGPGSLGALVLFDQPYDGLSADTLGLVGANNPDGSATTLKIQPYFLTDGAGGLAVPPDAASNPSIGGMLTWNDLPFTFQIFGAPTYWATWTVTPVK